MSAQTERIGEEEKGQKILFRKKKKKKAGTPTTPGKVASLIEAEPSCRGNGNSWL